MQLIIMVVTLMECVAKDWLPVEHYIDLFLLLDIGNQLDLASPKVSMLRPLLYHQPLVEP